MRSHSAVMLILTVMVLNVQSAWGQEVQSFQDTRRGLNMDLMVTGGEPIVGGGAGEIWDAAGDFGIVPGIGARLGYMWQRFGIQTGFDLTSSNPADRDGSGLGLHVLAHWRIAPYSRWNPTFGIGYVRHALSGRFGADEFPYETVTDQPDDYPPFEAGSVTTYANGLRLELGGSVPIVRSSLDLTFVGIGDVLSFPNVEFNGETHSLMNKGRGFWPRLAIGLRWHP